MQRMLLADCLNPEVTPTARAQAVRAFCEAEERKRIIRMQAKPRDIDTLALAELKLRSMKKAPTVFLDDVSKSKPIDVATNSQVVEPTNESSSSVKETGLPPSP